MGNTLTNAASIFISEIASEKHFSPLFGQLSGIRHNDPIYIFRHIEILLMVHLFIVWVFKMRTWKYGL